MKVDENTEDEENKIDILKTETKIVTRWSKLPIFYKILVIILLVVIIFVPVLIR